MSAIVHVVDDDEAMRESLDLLLASAGYTARLYESALVLLERLSGLEQGCIVTDVRMPGMDGLQLVNELKRRGAPHPIVVLTGHADVALAVQAMKAGVVEFIEKPFDDTTLLDAVKAALSLDLSGLVSQEDRAEFARRIAQLTAREREVFDAVVEGESNKSAARRLGISPRTIEIYRANMMSKMGADNLSQLVRMAVRCSGPNS
jgi:two-component system response regulator FixJ